MNCLQKTSEWVAIVGEEEEKKEVTDLLHWRTERSKGSREKSSPRFCAVASHEAGDGAM